MVQEHTKLGLEQAEAGGRDTFSVGTDAGAFSVGKDDKAGSVDIGGGGGRDVQGTGTDGGDVELGEPCGSTEEE